MQSVERAFDLLEVLAKGEEVGVTELANLTGLVPSTAHRLLATLTKRGYVSQSTDSSRYALGYKVVEVANGLEHSLSRLRGLTRPHLESLQQATGETTNLVVLDSDRVIYVDQVEGTRSVRMFTIVGASAMAHTTASGKAIMAFADPGTVEALYAGKTLERLTPRTLTTVDELQEDLERIARRGYAIDNEEHEEGVSCVAAPVFDRKQRPCGAISISAPTARVVHGDTAELAGLLREHAAEISSALGNRGNGSAPDAP